MDKKQIRQKLTRLESKLTSMKYEVETIIREVDRGGLVDE